MKPHVSIYGGVFRKTENSLRELGPSSLVRFARINSIVTDAANSVVRTPRLPSFERSEPGFDRATNGPSFFKHEFRAVRAFKHMKFKWVISSKYTCWRFKTRHESPNIAYPCSKSPDFKTWHNFLSLFL